MGDVGLFRRSPLEQLALDSASVVPSCWKALAGGARWLPPPRSRPHASGPSAFSRLADFVNHLSSNRPANCFSDSPSVSFACGASRESPVGRRYGGTGRGISKVAASVAVAIQPRTFVASQRSPPFPSSGLDGTVGCWGVWERWWNLGPLMQGPLDAPWIDGLGRRCGLRCVMC